MGSFSSPNGTNLGRGLHRRRRHNVGIGFAALGISQRTLDYPRFHGLTPRARTLATPTARLVAVGVRGDFVGVWHRRLKLQRDSS